MRIFRRAALSLLIAIGGLTTVAAPAVLATDPCNGSSTNQVFVVKRYWTTTVTPSQGFDYASSYVTVRNLDVCEGGFNWDAYRGIVNLGANIEAYDGIFQLGYKDSLGTNLEWGYAHESANYTKWYGIPDPVPGRTYQLEVFLSHTGAVYKIHDLTTGAVYTNSIARTHGEQHGYYAWWGAERLDQRSEIGTAHGGTPAKFWRMTYSKGSDSNEWTVSNLDATDITTTATNYGADFLKTTGRSCHHVHVSSTDYTNDTVAFDNTYNCSP